MRPAPLLVALCLLVGASPARARRTRAPAAREHFIDFRARPGALWGHTFIVYGRVDERGQPLELHRAGLYPDDGRPGLILGIFVPVPATVRAVPRRLLRDAERDLPAHAQRRANTRGSRPRWRGCAPTSGPGTCCCTTATTSRIAVAHALGLATPPNFLVPNAWVRALRAMNGG